MCCRMCPGVIRWLMPWLKFGAVTKCISCPSSVRSVKLSTFWMLGASTSSSTPRAVCGDAAVVAGVDAGAEHAQTSAMSASPISHFHTRMRHGARSSAAQLLQALRKRWHDLLPVAHHAKPRVLEDVGVAVAVDGDDVA